MPKYDTMGPEKFHDIPANELKEIMKKHDLNIKGSINDLRKRCKNHQPPIPTKQKYRKMIKGYVGQPIGLLELLWRRGYIDPAVNTKELPNDKQCRLIAKNIPQFKNELSEIEIVMKELDVEIVFTPKAHCKIAGRGIEYVWRVAKMMFRKENATLDNDKRVNTLKARVKKIMTDIPLEIYQKCCRHAREYKLSYAALLEDDETNVHLKLTDIEKMKKCIKNKRCAMDQDYGLVKKMVNALDVVDEDIKKVKDMKFEFVDNKIKTSTESCLLYKKY